MSETHEKYVSIEWEKWNSYYKPLEELNKSLQEKIDKSDIKFYVNRSWGNGHKTMDYMGHVSLSIYGGITIKNFNKEEFIAAIEKESGIRLRKTKEDTDREEKILTAYKRLCKIPRLIKFLFRIKY